jgi:hypothetical protein
MCQVIDVPGQGKSEAKLTEESKIEELLHAAAEYAARACEQVVPHLDDGQLKPNELFYDYVRLAHGLEVHFLFPTLSANERDLLVSLMIARSAALRALQAAQHELSEAAKPERQARITQQQSRFETLRTQVLDQNLLDKLTYLQRRLLQKGFLGIPS